MGMTVRKIANPAFEAYGRVVTGYDFGDLLMAVEHTPLPEDAIYIPPLSEMEALSDVRELGHGIYGQMPIQVGRRNGHNKKLNVVEYHQDSEVNIAVDDPILTLRKQQNIGEDHTYNISRIETFLVPAETAVKVYATALRYTSCHMKDKDFRCIIVLLKGTSLNMEPVDAKGPEDGLLFARNKWLIDHTEGGLSEGAFTDSKGKNSSV